MYQDYQSFTITLISEFLHSVMDIFPPVAPSFLIHLREEPEGFHLNQIFRNTKSKLAYRQMMNKAFAYYFTSRLYD